MTVPTAPSVGMRLRWTALLVLIALGGAGLAVAADRIQGPLQRPELTWRADRDAQPWIRGLADELTAVDERIVRLSAEGRHVLSEIHALDLARMRTAQAAGDEINAEMAVDVASLSSLRARALEAVDLSRLGPLARTGLEELSDATVSAEQVSMHWRALSSDAGRGAGLVDALLRHDGLVFRATTAGRQAEWDDALAFMNQATSPLADASQIRAELAGAGDVTTLDDLLVRYRAHDASLTALYTYIRDTDRQDGAEFDALQLAVDRAQEALPADARTMSAIVSEAAGPSLTSALVAIEAAHVAIRDALAVANGAPSP